MATVSCSFEDLVRIAKDTYVQTFGASPNICCRAPGRVNLIGEHIDYNDGYTLPMALPLATVIVGGKNDTEKTVDILTCSEHADEPRRIRFETFNLSPGMPKWANYVKGVIHYFGHPVPGFNAVIASNVPLGGGLSSSAALEVATFTFLEEITGEDESATEKSLKCQEAEHKFGGTPCGIMDQTIAVSGRKNHALLIDCKSLETFQIPFDSKDVAVLICNSNVRHELSKSEYPTRRRTVAKALELMGLRSFRDATEDQLSALREEVLVKRARHVITEIKRTCEAAIALRMGDYEKVGELMTKSHASLRDDFEVSCEELDVLVESAINCSGVLGSRLTGGGFGGCTVTLVRLNDISNVIATIKETYKKRFGIEAEFYICTPADGAQVLSAS